MNLKFRMVAQNLFVMRIFFSLPIVLLEQTTVADKLSLFDRKPTEISIQEKSPQYTQHEGVLVSNQSQSSPFRDDLIKGRVAPRIETIQGSISFNGRAQSKIESTQGTISSRIESNRRSIQSRIESNRRSSPVRINPIEDRVHSRITSNRRSSPFKGRSHQGSSLIEDCVKLRIEDEIQSRIVTNQRSCPRKIESIHASSLFEDRKAILDVGSQNLTHSNLTCKIVSVHSTRGSVGVIKD